jgi:hypothetical protein
MSQHSFTLRVFQSSDQVQGHLKKVIGVIDAKGVYEIITNSDLNTNPRRPKTGKITNEILDSLDTAPELFMFKSKGLLISSYTVVPLERNRYKISFQDQLLEGILDGGHNTLALAIYLLGLTFPDETIKINNWDDLKEEWKVRHEQVLHYLKTENPDFFVPIEIIYPVSEEYDDQFVTHILEISSSRNNNVQLTETAKG